MIRPRLLRSSSFHFVPSRKLWRVPGGDEFSDRGVFEFIDHRETVIAGSSMSSIRSEGCGGPSPASIISPTYTSAASFMFANASCGE